jgi:hypothetical protein
LTVRQTAPEVGVLVLSQYVEKRYAVGLLTQGATAVGYLLKDRVAHVDDFLTALDRIVDGGAAFDPEVVRQLLARTIHSDPLDTLTRASRGAGTDGRRLHERGNRGRAARVAQRGGEARQCDLRQARSAPVGQLQPPGAGGPALPRIARTRRAWPAFRWVPDADIGDPKCDDGQSGLPPVVSGPGELVELVVGEFGAAVFGVRQPDTELDLDRSAVLGTVPGRVGFEIFYVSPGHHHGSRAGRVLPQRRGAPLEGRGGPFGGLLGGLLGGFRDCCGRGGRDGFDAELCEAFALASSVRPAQRFLVLLSHAPSFTSTRSASAVPPSALPASRASTWPLGTVNDPVRVW